jgi:hypothetical protein
MILIACNLFLKQKKLFFWLFFDFFQSFFFFSSPNEWINHDSDRSLDDDEDNNPHLLPQNMRGVD